MGVKAVTSVRREVSIVLFDQFELLDVCGPVEFFGSLPDLFTVTMVGPEVGPVRSKQGVDVLATQSYLTAHAGDIVMVPGGQGTRTLVNDDEFLSWLAGFARSVELVTSVCTGSALLAAAGLLDGYRATSNKFAFGWASRHGQTVTWIPQARWVEDRNRWTSSGVTAGMDMTAALIRSLHGDDTADRVANHIEYSAHRDPTWDPFAELYGLTDTN
ncbi:DJ-1/PfpI family protein [Mycobacterium sp. MAA66]|uniref:DJ-1/PfpI family protein n=1 Tax=Mycobacterium sp. MAA66 TaxID=3156297 RepID=UPI0035198430